MRQSPLEVGGMSDTKTTWKAHTLVVWNDSHFAYSFQASKHTNFFQSTKLFVSWQLSFIRSSYLGTWPLIVSSVDVFGYTKTCTCLRCEQGCKNKKLVTTKFSNFLQTLTLFFRHSANRTLVWPARSDKINGKHPQKELTVINVVFAGVNMPDHDVIFSQLAKELRNQVTPFVALLRSKDCTGVEIHF